MWPRFFVPDAGGATDVVLPAEEAGHLTRVLRLATGARIRVFDGRGHEWDATVTEAHKQLVRARLEHAVTPVREPGLTITLAAAVLKGDKMDDVIRDAVMLGVAAVRPVLTARTERSGAVAGRVGRWQRIAVASAKQCGRAVVPEVAAVDALTAVLDRPAQAPRLMLVEPGAAAPGACSLREVPEARRVELLIGPEGGWTADEMEQAAARGCRLVTLGAQTLRADAVPLVALTALRTLWGDL